MKSRYNCAYPHDDDSPPTPKATDYKLVLKSILILLLRWIKKNIVIYNCSFKSQEGHQGLPSSALYVTEQQQQSSKERPSNVLILSSGPLAAGILWRNYRIQPYYYPRFYVKLRTTVATEGRHNIA
jgi:hypothetical protein